MRHSAWTRLAAATLLLSSTVVTAYGQAVTTNHPGAPIANAAGGGPATTLGTYTPLTYFNVGATLYTIKTLPVTPVPLAQPGAFQPNNANALNILEEAFPDADFTVGGALAGNGAINIRTYATYFNSPLVGEQFYASYNPGVGDPAYNGSNNLAAGLNGMHWIQVISNTWSLSGGPGVSFTDVDNLGANNPYYDSLGAANGAAFFDSPQRDSTDLPSPNAKLLQWTAELFVVDQTGVNGDGAPEVTIYNGVQYGFSIQTPEPGMFAYLVVFCGCGVVGVGKRRFRR